MDTGLSVDQDSADVAELSLAFEQKMAMLSHTLNAVESKCHGLNSRLVNAEGDSSAYAHRCATRKAGGLGWAVQCKQQPVHCGQGSQAYGARAVSVPMCPHLWSTRCHATGLLRLRGGLLCSRCSSRGIVRSSSCCGRWDPAGTRCLAFSAYPALSISSPETAQFCTVLFDVLGTHSLCRSGCYPHRKWITLTRCWRNSGCRRH